MSKKLNPAPEAQVCDWIWPMTSVQRVENFPCSSHQTDFSRRQSISRVEALLVCKFVRAKNIDPSPPRKTEKVFGETWLFAPFDPRVPRQYVSHTSIPLSTFIQISRRRSETGVILKRSAVPSVSLWKKEFSRWSGRLHPTAANRTQVDELPPSYVCLPANLFLSLFSSSLSVISLFFFSLFLLAAPSLAGYSPSTLEFLALFCSRTSTLWCKGSQHGTKAVVTQKAPLVSYSPSINTTQEVCVWSLKNISPLPATFSGV